VFYLGYPNTSYNPVKISRCFLKDEYGKSQWYKTTNSAMYLGAVMKGVGTLTVQGDVCWLKNVQKYEVSAINKTDMKVRTLVLCWTGFLIQGDVKWQLTMQISVPMTEIRIMKSTSRQVMLIT
jgi:hypothetical protein